MIKPLVTGKYFLRWSTFTRVSLAIRLPVSSRSRRDPSEKCRWVDTPRGSGHQRIGSAEQIGTPRANQIELAAVPRLNTAAQPFDLSWALRREAPECTDAWAS